MSKEKKILVGTGENATITTRNNNIYCHPINWDCDYDTVVIIYEGKINYIGTVMESMNGLSKDLSTDRIVSLTPVQQIGNISLGQIYSGKGAFTMSHEYHTIESFVKKFNSN